MSNDTQRRPRQGGGQRGGRNRQSNNRGRNNRNRRDRGPRKNTAPKKLSLWDRIVLFFSFQGEKPHPRTGPAKTPQARGPQTRNQRQGDQGKRKNRERPARKVEKVEVTNPRLYVGNLSYDATESDLVELFKGVGQVNNAEVVTNRHTQRSKGFAFIEMQTIEEAKRAVEVLHDQEFMTRKLLVSGAKKKTVDTQEDRRSEPQDAEPATPVESADAPATEQVDTATEEKVDGAS